MGACVVHENITLLLFSTARQFSQEAESHLKTE